MTGTEVAGSALAILSASFSVYVPAPELHPAVSVSGDPWRKRQGAKAQRRQGDDEEKTIAWLAESGRFAEGREKQSPLSALASLRLGALALIPGPSVADGVRRQEKLNHRGADVTAAADGIFCQTEDPKACLLLKRSQDFSAGLMQPCPSPVFTRRVKRVSFGNPSSSAIICGHLRSSAVCG